jgi:hypothetical protein
MTRAIAVITVAFAGCVAAQAPDPSQTALTRAEGFMAQGLWDEAVAASEEAVKAVDDGAGQEAIPAACGRASTWLMYGHLQQGRFTEARRLVLACSRRIGTHGGAAWVALAAMRSHYLVETEDWSGEVASLAVPDVHPAATFYGEYANGYAAVGRHDLPAVRRALSRMEAARQALATGDGSGSPRALSPTNAARLQIMRNQVGALLGGIEGAPFDASKRLVAIAEAEDALPHEAGPPSIHKPSWELAGEALMYYETDQARAAFEKALTQHPGRTAALSGLRRAAAVQGDDQKEAEVKARLDKNLHRADTKARK